MERLFFLSHWVTNLLPYFNFCLFEYTLVALGSRHNLYDLFSFLFLLFSAMGSSDVMITVVADIWIGFIRASLF